MTAPVSGPAPSATGLASEGRPIVVRTSRDGRARTARAFTLPLVPASFFGMVLGLVGLGNAWRAAARVWGAPPLVGELVMLAGAGVWAAVLALYVGKWFLAREAALAEARHPVQCCFIGLAGVATTLASMAVLPYSRAAAVGLFAAGSAFTAGFAVWRTGELWKGERDVAATTPVLYLPTVAGGFVTATAAAALGYRELGQLAFGAGLFSWLAIESVLLQRLYSGPRLAAALRPTLGIQLAPPAVGGVAAASVLGEPAGLLPLAMLGYALLQALLLLRLLPWIREQAFVPGYWGFAFGATALGALPLRLMERGDAPLVAALAPALFAVANVVMAALALGTLRLLVAGRLLPQPVPAPD